MSPEQFELVLNANLNAREDGVTIKRGEWGVEAVEDSAGIIGWYHDDSNKCACALSCLLLKDGRVVLKDQTASAASVLQTTEFNINAFITGFDDDEFEVDDYPDEFEAEAKAWYDAGTRMATALGL